MSTAEGSEEDDAREGAERSTLSTTAAPDQALRAARMDRNPVSVLMPRSPAMADKLLADDTLLEHRKVQEVEKGFLTKYEV